MFTYYDYDLNSAIECAKNVANKFNRVVHIYQEFGRYLLTSQAIENPVTTIGGVK